MMNIELLAPARNAEIGIAAIDCGADAVYIAGPEFGARQAAGNSLEDIKLLCDYAHRFGVRIFVTLNTILFEDEVQRASELIKGVVNAGVDALIVQDASVVKLAQDADGNLIIPLHASTQCAIRTPDVAQYYESLGFSRLVLERNLSFEQIREIRKAVKCEIEFFVHGALCVSYSGQCYISEYIEGRSANRGECIQACRSRYDLVDENGKVWVKNKALLSLKDFNLKNRIEEMAESGICSYKIEGRLKNISYVKNIVREYSLALDELCMKFPEKYKRASFGRVESGFTPDPSKTFNRGYTELFIDGTRGKWAAMDTPKSMGEEIGKIKAINRRNANEIDVVVKPLKSDLSLNNGDGFSFATDKGIVGFRGEVCQGVTIRCKSVSDIKVGQTLFRNMNVAFERELEKNRCARIIDVKTCISIKDGYTIHIEAVTEDGRIVVRDFVSENEPAQDIERMKGVIKNQIERKTDIYSFSLNELNISTSDCSIPFMRAAELNSIRREIADVLNEIPVIFTPLMKGRDMKTKYPEKVMTYKDNIANSIAAEVVKEHGATLIEDAFEVSHRKGVELMRTKYCIKFELGMCPVHQKAKPVPPLFLLNNGRRFALKFDCKACEMTVNEAD